MDMMWRPPAGGQSSNEKDQERPASQQRSQSSGDSQSRGIKASGRTRKAGKGKPPLFGIVAIIIVLVIAVAGYMMLNRPISSSIDGGKYQAVFLSNGQVYFGKLQTLNSEYMRLTDIYYLQSQQSATEVGNSDNPQESSDGNVQLIKLGEEIHGPEDEMILAKEHMLFFENLKTDGNVTRSINQHKNTR
jgi:hypothetical protein